MSDNRYQLLLYGLLATLLSCCLNRADAGVVLSLQRIGGDVTASQTVQFDVVLNYSDSPDDGSLPIIAFALNIGGSDAALTNGGTDFSAFSFSLNPGLAGSIGGEIFAGDISLDGRVEFGADLFGLNGGDPESGLLPTGEDVLLGTLTVVAPTAAGAYNVGFFVDSLDPFGGTYFLIDDGSLFGILVPSDVSLTTQSESFAVVSEVTPVPEPSTLALFGMGAVGLLGCRRPRPPRLLGA